MSDELRDKVARTVVEARGGQGAWLCITGSARAAERHIAARVLDIREIREALEARDSSRKLAGLVADAELARDEARAALAAAQAREAKLREAVADLLEHVETEHCDVIGAIQEARALLASPAPAPDVQR